MIEPKDYAEKVEEYFGFLIEEFGFKLLEKKIKGNVYYDVQYRKNDKLISISYENIEDYLLVIIFILHDNQLPQYDDEEKTLHLNKLTAQILPTLDGGEIQMNSRVFGNFRANNEVEKKLLKLA